MNDTLGNFSLNKVTSVPSPRLGHAGDAAMAKAVLALPGGAPGLNAPGQFQDSVCEGEDRQIHPVAVTAKQGPVSGPGWSQEGLVEERASGGMRSETEEVVAVRTLPILWTMSRILCFVLRVPGRHGKV